MLSFLVDAVCLAAVTFHGDAVANSSSCTFYQLSGRFSSLQLAGGESSFVVAALASDDSTASVYGTTRLSEYRSRGSRQRAGSKDSRRQQPTAPLRRLPMIFGRVGSEAVSSRPTSGNRQQHTTVYRHSQSSSGDSGDSR
ncbi:hypothetical protein BIW11_11891 [Tropilaelaps mercedesae]|uniref:Secreted protein n=1 Tax=Tropilaelaps mercedesae TaxID=418985 RepID=A0A1V9X9Q7_9ACAR|nr:hypothetical protein BIW11_11891 [Tropilaelaps mercedesae]